MEALLGRFPLPWRLAIEKLPLFALVVISCLVTRWAQRKAAVPFDLLPLSWRIGNALVSYVAYLGQFLYPTGLAVFYPHPSFRLSMEAVVGAALVLAGISAAAVACRRRCPYLLVGWLWYVGMLVPVIGLKQVGGQARADRYTYLPQIGLCLAIAWGVAELCRSRVYLRRPCGVMAALVLAVLMACAWRQTCFWHDSEALWIHTLACTSPNSLARNNLGSHLADCGRLEAAMAQYRQALKIQPNYGPAYEKMGACFGRSRAARSSHRVFSDGLEISTRLRCRPL